MSFDIEIIQKKEEFKEVLLARGGKAVDDGILVENDKPALAVGYEDGWLDFNYSRNHYHVYFAYDLLLDGVNKIPGFEFKDPQSSTVINATNKKVVTGQYLDKLAANYILAGQNIAKVMGGVGAIRVDGGGMTPVKKTIMHRLSDDLYNIKAYKERTREVYGDVYFPRPFVYVDPRTKKIKIQYSWMDLIEQLFPADLEIGDIALGFWNSRKNDVEKTIFYSAKELFARLPKPEEVEDEIMGKRLLYKGLSKNGGEYTEILEGLVPVEYDKNYLLDEGLGSLFSVP